MMIQFLNYPIFTGTLPDCVTQIDRLLSQPGFHTICTLNPEMVVWAKDRGDLDQFIQQAAFCTIDGTGIQWALKRQTGQWFPKICGVDLLHHLLSSSRYRCYLLGADDEVIKRLTGPKSPYTKTAIVGAHHGYFTDSDWPKIKTEIQTLAPDIVAVAMGTPKQEAMIKELKSIVTKGIGIGVGGSLDVLSGLKPHAPKWVRRLGLEWMFRILMDWKRIKRVGRLIRFLRYS